MVYNTATEKTLICNLELSMRTINALDAGGYKIMDQLLSATHIDLLCLPNFGRKCLNEIKTVLEINKFKLGQNNGS